MTPNTFSLVADIGGTNTRCALAVGPQVQVATIRRYRNAEHAGLETVIHAFIDDMDGVDCKGAAVAVAGPVRDGVGTMTNLDWAIDKPTLARATRAEAVAILNDLQAQGQAVGYTDPSNVTRILSGPSGDPGPHAAKLVIGVGTGFNAAPIWEAEQGRLVPPSECGHANLPIRTERELRLCKYVETAHGFPAVEDVLSGRGLERVYRFLGAEADDPIEKSAADIMGSLDSDPRAEEAARFFTKILGTVAGNLSLIHLPFGGVFLIGGVARAFKDRLIPFGFGEAFRDKGRFAGFMSNFSVSMIEDDYAALTGLAAHLAREMANSGNAATDAERA
ncbi:glucokinase [Hasllibacter halocynthiae]|uniref:Glucokinase n=1 Tax=Hasllibacter halocynthiae TaxID=595589 RepID=A0A2T0X8N2_9RHOB|nr:glucokinase [Hasllibacter halocynthiae]PRY95277.1 glucokinase [Hasllibacter halocynthiae]